MGNTKNSTATTPNATSMPDATPQNSLIYGLDDRPPLREALFAALQHLLAIFVAIITPPLIIAGALQADHKHTGLHRTDCFWYFNLHPMPPHRSCRLRTALHPRHKFLLHRPHHLGRTLRRPCNSFRCLHRRQQR